MENTKNSGYQSPGKSGNSNTGRQNDQSLSGQKSSTTQKGMNTRDEDMDDDTTTRKTDRKDKSSPGKR